MYADATDERAVFFFHLHQVKRNEKKKFICCWIFHEIKIIRQSKIVATVSIIRSALASDAGRVAGLIIWT